MNLLLIDAGNTQVKWAICHENTALTTPMDWYAHGQFSSQKLCHETLSFLENHSLDVVLISSVLLGHETAKLQEIITSYSSAPCHTIDGTVGLDRLPTRYSNPQQLGSDRRSMLLAAHQLYPHEHLLIVCAGTATTMDVLSSDQGHLGGWILPGIGMSMDALTRGTANLKPEEDEACVQPALGLNTNEAIKQGIMASQCAAIEYATHLAKKLNTPVDRILVDGGYGAAFLNHLLDPALRAKCIHTPQLCLIGLLVWYKEALKS